MAWQFNPFTGKLDVDVGSGWTFNPFTNRFDYRRNTSGWVFNPFTGKLDLVGPPVIPTGNFILWGPETIAWGSEMFIWGI